MKHHPPRRLRGQKGKIMAKAKIKAVTENEVRYIVEYETGSVRYYDTDKLPGTVKAWLSEHKEPEQEPDPDPVQPAQEPVKAAQELKPIKVSQEAVSAFPDRPNALTVALWSLYFVAGVILYMGWWAAQACAGAAVVADRIRTVTAPTVKQLVRRGAGQIACLWRWRAALLAEIP